MSKQSPQTLSLVAPLTRTRTAELESHMSCWKNAHAFIRTLPANQASIKTLREMLYIEYNGNTRIHMLSRLHMRLNKLRYEVESKELMG